MRKVVERFSEEIEVGSYGSTLGDLIMKLHEIEETTPRDAKVSGYVSGYDGEYYTIYFSYVTHETDEEYEKRIFAEQCKKKIEEGNEKETYLRLKEKYE